MCYLNHPFVVDCLAGKWTDCVTKMLVSLNLIFVLFHPNVCYLNYLSVVDCLDGKWTDYVTKRMLVSLNLICPFFIQMCTI